MQSVSLFAVRCSKTSVNYALFELLESAKEKQQTRLNCGEDGESKSKRKRVRTNWGQARQRWREGRAVHKEKRLRRRGEMVKENCREHLREILLHVSASGPRCQCSVKITCPIMKRDCSPFYLRYFTADQHPIGSLLTYTSPVYIQMQSYIASDNVISKLDWDCSLSFIKIDCSVNIPWLARLSSPRSI